jgi:hypothetical protein
MPFVENVLSEPRPYNLQECSERTWTRQRAARNNLMMPAAKAAHKQQRLLGAYLFGLCLYQIGIYRWPGGPPFILDPRAGIAVLLINHFSFDNKVIYPVEWITAAWLVLMASMILFRGQFLKIYLISELALATPTAYYIGVLAVQHGGDFAPGFKDLLLTIFLFIVFSVVPAGMAARCVWRTKRLPA